MKKIVITYGLISAAISAIMWTCIALLMRSGNFDHGMIVGYTSMLLSIFVIYFAMKTYRDNVAGGTIKFGKALLIGLYISIIFAVCYVITWMILRQTLLPDFVDNYIAYEKKGLQQAGLSPEAMSKKLAEIDQMRSMFANPWMEALMVFTEPWPVAILVTLVSAFIVSRKRKQEDSRDALLVS
jgi:hypothetical protein